MGKLYDEQALARYEMIAPLLNDALDPFDRRELTAKIREQYHVSARTIRRYLRQCQTRGWTSLSRLPRKDKGEARAIRPEVVDAAVKLREELPSRSVRRILEILEGEKLIKRAEVARTTLNEHLIMHGMGAEQLRAQGKLGTQPHKRFMRKDRNGLWEADLKYGPYLVSNGKKTKTYVITFIDDATRMIMHSEYYSSQRLPILEDCFRKALMKYGKPKDVLVDNGKIFVSKWFTRACACLGIRHLRAKPYHAATKGVVEKYNQYIDQFHEELTLEPAKTLEDLNRKYRCWMEEGYIHKIHSALKAPSDDRSTADTYLTPIQAYSRNPAKVKYVSTIECKEAFLWEETRKVDRAGCFKLVNVEYDAGVDLIGKKVDVRYDPFDVSIVEIWYGGVMKKRSEPLVMPEFLPRIEQANPVAKAKATHSRLLKVYAEKNKVRDRQRNTAVSFRDLTKRKDGTSND
ncbi:transposase [Clostridia bacterium]|nr:transposase [Clostridia bacterium]